MGVHPIARMMTKFVSGDQEACALVKFTDEQSNNWTEENIAKALVLASRTGIEGLAEAVEAVLRGKV